MTNIMENGINVLSLFDGMSCGRIALDRAGITVNRYFASEVDKYAIRVALKNYPDTVQIGDVTLVKGAELPQIDLLIGGSPCQGFSFAGKQLNFNDPRSKLFFEFVRLLDECKPKYFLLENVKMKKEYQDVITEHLGVEPIEINSSLVSAQNRKRLYWTNIPDIQQPKDKGIYIQDILLQPKSVVGAIRGRYNEDRSISQVLEIRKDKKSNTLTTVTKDNVVVPEKYYLSPAAIEYMNRRVKTNGKNHWEIHPPAPTKEDKSNCIVAAYKSGIPYNVIIEPDTNDIRKLTPLECERLQTVPDGYTDCVSDTQRYKMLGNGWTVDVIAHILSHI